VGGKTLAQRGRSPARSSGRVRGCARRRLDGALAEEAFVRLAALQALQPLDLTELEFPTSLPDRQGEFAVARVDVVTEDPQARRELEFCQIERLPAGLPLTQSSCRDRARRPRYGHRRQRHRRGDRRHSSRLRASTS
jgi:hypothetical protein